MTRRRVLAVVAALGVLPPLALCGTAALTSLPEELDAPAGGAVRVVDRGGRLLREVRAGDGKRARVLPLEELGAEVPRAIVAAEDRRFYEHPGVDVLALIRAAASDLWQRRVVSGGSTLTMQLARTLRPRRRTLAGKWREAALALRLEWSLPKRRILEEYLNRVDFGPNLRGVGAASHAYFDKPPAALSLAEAALLAGLPRGPSLYAVTRRPELARRRRDRVLTRLLASGLATPEAVAAALAEPVVVQREASAFGAPHLVQGLLEGSLRAAQAGLDDALAAPGLATVEATVEGPLQRAAEAATLAVVGQLAGRHVTAGAVVAIENATGDVLAYVGSPDFFDEARLGQNDGARALRQPGSALKPFLYGLAMERLGFTAATVLPDVELHLALPGGVDYAPRDYDDKLRGPVRLRDALGNSLNVPAVWTAEQVGLAELLARLHELHFDALVEGPDYYGPALPLGDGEVTLLELARAYTTLARHGVDRPLRFVRAVERSVATGPQAAARPGVERHPATSGPQAAPSPGAERRPGTVEELPEGEASRVMPAAVADALTDILKDPRARRASFDEGEALSFSFEVAAKTGTSKGFRDNWAVGYSTEVTVAAWVGNFDGTPMDQVSGITGAGPLFHAVMEAAMERRDKRPLPLDASAEDRAHGLPPAPGAPRADEPTAGEGDPEGASRFERVAICPLSGGAPTHACGARVFEWLPALAARALSPCDLHEEVAIDRRNGLRAGPGCPTEITETRVFERYPPDCAAWATSAARPTAPDAYSPLCPAADVPAEADGTLRVTYPHDGARFVLDPERPRELQAVEVLIVAPAGVRAVGFRVDGGPPTRLAPPFSLSWRLAPGDHTLAAEATGHGSAAVHVSVR